MRADYCPGKRISSLCTPGHDVSLYILPAQCESSGIYQAFYYSAADNTTCLFSCFFPIEVEETRPDILREDFSSLYRESKQANMFLLRN